MFRAARLMDGFWEWFMGGRWHDVNTENIHSKPYWQAIYSCLNRTHLYTLNNDSTFAKKQLVGCWDNMCLIFSPLPRAFWRQCRDIPSRQQTTGDCVVKLYAKHLFIPNVFFFRGSLNTVLVEALLNHKSKYCNIHGLLMSSLRKLLV